MYPQKNKQHARLGTLLIELMIVICIVAVIFGLSLSQFSFFTRMRLMTDLHKLSTVIMYLQQRAIATGNSIDLVFNQNKKSYSYLNVTDTLDDKVVFGFVSGATGPPSNPSSPIKSPITFKNTIIVFSSDGTCSSGTVYLSDSAKKQSVALTTPVGEISHMRLYSYQNGWKLLE